jgi:acyl-coenzyme A synthetase/AMP-(fatty) acid ligase
VTDHPLLWADDADAPLAWRDGRALSRRDYLSDVAAQAEQLRARGPVLNVTADRYRFAVGVGAALLRGQSTLLPPNHTPDMVARLRGLYPDVYALTDQRNADTGLPTLSHAPASGLQPAKSGVPCIAADAVAAQVLTSGSTGAPVPHAKAWGLLVRNIDAEAQRLAEYIGRRHMVGVSLVATVPAQHMYGFESTVLIALLAGAAFDCGRPFYPADIAAALARVPRPRMLVTTPFHLKMLLESDVQLPPLDLTLCATAPLSPQLAAQAESAFEAPLVEIYGCTEAGQIATRRTTVGAEWHTYRDLRLEGDRDHAVVSGGHVAAPTALADVLEVIDNQHFRLLGRSNDLINIAGKRSSLSHLNYHLNTIPGVQDAAFWLPADDAPVGVVRLVAFVVAPGVSRDTLLAALRERVDPAFLPRRVIAVPALPRDSTGKLPAARLAEFAAQWLAQRADPQ